MSSICTNSLRRPTSVCENFREPQCPPKILPSLLVQIQTLKIWVIMLGTHQRIIPIQGSHYSVHKNLSTQQVHSYVVDFIDTQCLTVSTVTGSTSTWLYLSASLSENFGKTYPPFTVICFRSPPDTTCHPLQCADPCGQLHSCLEKSVCLLYYLPLPWITKYITVFAATVHKCMY